MMRIGVAMLQGARHEHCEAIQHAAHEMNTEVKIVQLRKASDIDDSIQALVLPGGESTTMRIASQSESLLDGIFTWMTNFPERPVLGTCAGAILLANPEGNLAPFIDVEVARNAWGRQKFSFEAPLDITLNTPDKISNAEFELARDKFNHKPLPMATQAAKRQRNTFPGVFIRAPRFTQGSIKCQKIAMLDDETVGVLDGSKLALTFHPELTNDRRFHRWLIAQIIHDNH